MNSIAIVIVIIIFNSFYCFGQVTPEDDTIIAAP